MLTFLFGIRHLEGVSKQCFARRGPPLRRPRRQPLALEKKIRRRVQKRKKEKAEQDTGADLAKMRPRRRTPSRRPTQPRSGSPRDALAPSRSLLAVGNGLEIIQGEAGGPQRPALSGRAGLSAPPNFLEVSSPWDVMPRSSPTRCSFGARRGFSVAGLRSMISSWTSSPAAGLGRGLARGAAPGHLAQARALASLLPASASHRMLVDQRKSSHASHHAHGRATYAQATSLGTHGESAPDAPTEHGTSAVRPHAPHPPRES